MGFGGQKCLTWTFSSCGVLNIISHLSSPEESGSLTKLRSWGT